MGAINYNLRYEKGEVEGRVRAKMKLIEKIKKHSNINGFRTPEQRNYLYSALLKPSISAAIARFISW